MNEMFTISQVKKVLDAIAFRNKCLDRHDVIEYLNSKGYTTEYSEQDYYNRNNIKFKDNNGNINEVPFIIILYETNLSIIKAELNDDSVTPLLEALLYQTIME